MTTKYTATDGSLWLLEHEWCSKPKPRSGDWSFQADEADGAPDSHEWRYGMDSTEAECIKQIEEMIEEEADHFIIEATDGSGYARNGLTFDTKEEAETYAIRLMLRWTACADARVVPVNEDGGHVA